MLPLTALILFALTTMVAIGVEILFTYSTQGIGFGFSSNRPSVDKSPLALRIQRAYQNQAEAAAYIVPILAAAALFDLDSPAAQITAAIIVFGRIAFILLYYTGIPFVRILGFMGGSFGSLHMAYLLYAAITSNAP